MKTFKRFSSYIIDIFFITGISSIINIILVNKNKISILNNQFNNINELVLDKTIKFGDYMIRFAEIIKDLSQEYIYSIICSIIITFVWFVLIPYYRNGQTLGLTLMKLKIASTEDEDISISSLIIRSFIVNGTLYSFILLILFYILTPIPYFAIISILGIIQILLVIISSFMVLYKRDKKGLQDILSKSIIADINEEVIE